MALIGYSFGADVLPVVYNMLPATYRDRVAMISLLGLEPKADWEIRVAGWFGAQPSETATPLAPEFARIPGELIQCYYGVEKDGCLGLTDKRAELIQRPAVIISGATTTRSPKTFWTAFSEGRHSRLRPPKR